MRNGGKAIREMVSQPTFELLRGLGIDHLFNPSHREQVIDVPVKAFVLPSMSTQTRL